MSPSVADYLPSFEAARAAEPALLGSKPDETERLAALVVAAQVVGPADFRRAGNMFEVYVPEVLETAAGMFGFESKVEEIIVPQRTPPPECLRCHDLRPRQVGGAYRQAQVEKAPDFHGHGFDDTIEQAIEALERFLLGHRGRQVDVRAWAWPLLVLRYGQALLPPTTAVVLVSQPGQHVVLVSEPEGEG